MKNATRSRLFPKKKKKEKKERKWKKEEKRKRAKKKRREKEEDEERGPNSHSRARVRVRPFHREFYSIPDELHRKRATIVRPPLDLDSQPVEVNLARRSFYWEFARITPMALSFFPRPLVGRIVV